MEPTDPSSSPAQTSHATALDSLDEILAVFGLERRQDGSRIEFLGDIPDVRQTKSENINLSLIGSIPAAANAIAASQIYEFRGGKPQSIEVDLSRGHNYLDPDIGMTPTINGQVRHAKMFLGHSHQRRH